MEQQYDCVKLHFHSPLHLSRGRDQYDEGATTLHSDTLISALFVAACRLGADGKEILSMLDTLRISSAFPFHETEYFFPKPMTALPFQLSDIAKEKQGKPFKKIRYIGKSWFEKLLHAETGNIQIERHLHRSVFLTDIPIGTVYKTDVIQRVAIAPDYTEDATPFYTERLYFGKNSGLFTLIKWEDTSARDLFQSAFRLLGDLGIGTDRSVGNGFFTPSFESISLRIPDQAIDQCALGLYLPERNELDRIALENSSWSLVKRGGYLAGAGSEVHITLRKKSVYMFDVGSIFSSNHLNGKRVDLKPSWQGLNHPVWREGRPIFVPIIKFIEP